MIVRRACVKSYVLNKRSEALLAALLLVVLAVQLVLVARATSATWDEPHHLFDGYTALTQHDYRINPEVPPLLKMVAALPLLHKDLMIPPNRGQNVQSEAFPDGRLFVFHNGGDRVLFPARMACMGVTLALALLLFFVARDLFGRVAAIVALSLFVFDPNFLANGALVTTDIAMSLSLLAALYAWYCYARAPGWFRLSLATVLAGLALVVKFTGLLLFPMLALLIGLEALRARSLRLLGKRCLALLCVGLGAWVILWSFYGFRYKAAPAGHELNPQLAVYLPTVPNPADAHRLEFAASYHLLPEAYIWGLANTKLTEDADNTYFFGHVYRHGSWKYFPAAFLIKSTLPFLLLLCAAPFAWSLVRWRKDPAFALLLAPVAFYLAVVMHAQINIGHRHLLPIYPLLYILAAGAAASLFMRNRRWVIVLGALLVWQVATSVHVAPGYMAYANEAWGGPDRTHRYLSDANTDWAQQLKEARLYLDQRHITNCWFAYFADGAIQPQDYGISCKRLPTTSTAWWLNLPEDVPPIISGTVLISDSDLEGIEFGQGALNPYDGFRGLKPTAVIQHGLYIYDGTFAIPLASAQVNVQHARSLLRANDVAAALVEAQQAVALAPHSVQAQMALADVLTKQARTSDALAHYQAALQAAQTIEPALQTDLIPDIEASIKALSIAR